METCDELIEYVASEAKASEDFFEKQRLETVEFGPDAKDVMLATVHEAQTKLQKEHMDAHAVNEQLTKYTDAFDRLRDAVGIDDLNDLDPAIQNFIKVEEECVCRAARALLLLRLLLRCACYCCCACYCHCYYYYCCCDCYYSTTLLLLPLTNSH